MDKFKVGDRVKAGRKHGTISKFASETLCVVDYDRGEWDYWLMEDLKPLQPKKQPAALQADAPAEPPPAVTGDLCHRCGGDEFIDYHDFWGESTLERIPCPECQKRKQDAEDLQDMNEALSDFRETVRQIVGRNTQHKTHNITDVLERDYVELTAARARIAALERTLRDISALACAELGEWCAVDFMHIPENMETFYMIQGWAESALNNGKET
jgi:hypothetical protein